MSASAFCELATRYLQTFVVSASAYLVEGLELILALVLVVARTL